MTPVLRPGVRTADTEYGVALLDERTGRYWNLNPTGAVVLRSLLAGETPEQAADRLTREFEIELAAALEDARVLIGELRSAGLVVDAPGGEGDER